jgi:hypothetical protein
MSKLTTKTISNPPTIQDGELYKWLGLLPDNIPYIRYYDVSFDPASVPANSFSRQNITVSGITTNDIIIVNPPTLTSNLEMISYRVSAVDTVTITFENRSGSSIDESSGVYRIIAIRV